MTKGLSCVRAAYSYNAEIASNAGVTTLNSGGGTHYVGVLEEYAVSGISGRKYLRTFTDIHVKQICLRRYANVRE